jgi:hypothetical protein
VPPQTPPVTAPEPSGASTPPGDGNGSPRQPRHREDHKPAATPPPTTTTPAPENHPHGDSDNHPHAKPEGKGHGKDHDR